MFSTNFSQIDFGIVGEEADQAENLASAARQLSAAALVEANASHRSDLARRDHPLVPRGRCGLPGSVIAAHLLGL